MKNKILVGVLFLLFTVPYQALGDESIKKWFLSDTTKEKKELKALKISEKLKIDGKLKEIHWEKAPVATDFKTYSPSIGDSTKYTTRVRTLYSDDAIYFAAVMCDDRDSILTGLSKRDDHNVNADKFWITLNPYNDGNNIFKFEVTAANVQNDIKISPRNHDRSWDAVWKSAVSITDSAWIVEIKIPYDAIRFPKSNEQTWGINFWRSVRRKREISAWNFVDRTKDNHGSQYGELTNIRNIEPPFRLSLFPYVSGYVFPDKSGTDYSYSAGMDLKYGINESYTLDMILIPDFGQKKSDNTVLNLSPYEVKYSEKRPFFTEGTELFNKAGLFYSRRVGGEPSGYYDIYDQLNDNDEIVENPKEANLINATKISGRNPNGLGLGIFNAITGKTYATIERESGEKDKYLTEPFTNYNMLVADKTFGQNSYLNIINTNYYQPNTKKTEDVIGSAFKFSDPRNIAAIWGSAAYSMQRDSANGSFTTGQKIDARIGKVSGDFQFNYRFRMLTDKYTHNAMGYLRRNNELKHRLTFKYGEYEPSKYFQNWRVRTSLNYNKLYNPDKFTDFDIVLSAHATLKNYLSVGSWSKFRPVKMDDYFEPRVEGRVFKRPRMFYTNFWFSTDYRKPIALDGKLGGFEGNGSGYFFEIGPRFRVNNKLQFQYKFEYRNDINEKGYVTNYYPENDTIIFGKRNKITYTNTLGGSYVFNNKSWLTLNIRHYWAQVDYNKFYTLREKGTLADYPGYNENEDINFNTFNIDLTYSWNFAPGSFLTVVYKNNIYEQESITNDNFYDFFNNLKNTINSDEVENSFSIKISYYLDYKYLLNQSG